LEPSVTDHTAHYLLGNNYTYVIDIVNLGDAQSPNLTPNLWLYERPQPQHEFTPMPQSTGFPQNPFSLWAPAAMPDMRAGFPGIIRLDALRLSALWHAHDYELVETNGTVVLALEFRVQSVHGAQAGPAQAGIEMHELLQQLKELHAPDRCEGVGNFFWRGIQRVTHIGSSEKTDQQKITDHWNASQESSGVQQKSELKTLASWALHDFYFVCREVDENRAVQFYTRHQKVWDILSSETPSELATKQGDIDTFINDSSRAQVQQMFDVMIVQWAWRDCMLSAWRLI